MFYFGSGYIRSSLWNRDAGAIDKIYKMYFCTAEFAEEIGAKKLILNIYQLHSTDSDSR